MKDRKNSSLLRRLEKLPRLFFVALLSVLAVGAFAQSKTCLLYTSTVGTITDIDGVFKLDVPKGAKLLISFIGYSSKTVEVKLFQC